MPRIPKVTGTLIALFAVLTLGRAIVGPWLGLVDILQWLALVPDKVLHGQVWRLVSWPFFSRPFMESQAFGFLWTGIVLYFVGQPLESLWGSRRLARRVVWLIVAPAALTVLLALAVEPMRFIPYFDPSSLIVGMFVAFGASLGPQAVQFWPFPFQLKGDHVIALTGVFVLLDILLNGTILPFMTDVFAFAFAVAWLRLDLVKDARKSWLRHKKGRVEAKLTRLKKERNLRVVRFDDDDEDEPKKPYLH